MGEAVGQARQAERAARSQVEAEVVEETKKFRMLLLESNNKITELMNTNNELSIRLQIHEERVK